MPQTLGRYQLLRRLAVGGMGEVWIARPMSGTPPTSSGGLVVVKRLLEHLKDERDFVTMFLDEARIASALAHPNIARIIELGEANGDFYIAMEWVHGVAFSEVLSRAAAVGDRIIPLELSCRIVADAAAGLDFAHRAVGPNGKPLDIIHRDVSPQNILVGFDGITRLIDFGIAKATNKLTKTATGIIKGKYAYMSPEQAYDEPLDRRSDVFALGIVLWEALCGKRLFKRETEADTLHSVVEAVVEAPSKVAPHVPAGLDDIALEALQRERELRTPSAEHLRLALEAFLARHRYPASHTHLAALMHEYFPVRRVPPTLEQLVAEASAPREEAPTAASPGRQRRPAR